MKANARATIGLIFLWAVVPAIQRDLAAQSVEPEPRSALIRDLAQSVDAAEQAAVEDFKELLRARGMPLVERIPGSDSVLVTFV